MARLPRLDLPNIPQHVIQRGNNRQACFYQEKDYKAYLNWLKYYSLKENVAIHAWVLMTNHVHLLCTPRKPKAVSLMMQGLGRRYVQYFNHSNQRTGTLWEGRFKSCLVQNRNYLLEVYRYIESNPVRSGMVNSPAEYPWSSYQINALGKRSDLATYHEQYIALGQSEAERQHSYSTLFKSKVVGQNEPLIRKSVSRGGVLGDEKFKSAIEAITGRRVTSVRRGRPKTVVDTKSI
ncbi:transposase [Thalassotalea sp. 1_MG-2023]|uniref:transposase n=1 Tax=Thalassotalea sp. 1_MG-2023 TaxID=3062680 RepID=UPI0026E211EC|nr:transposase [Thalassotalea sp. 1_MG-2023]MDO6426674.1 transposase [Thalassotalea sp. 1_MG-2023]